VRCKADVPIAIDFGRALDGRYVGWLMASHDPLRKITVTIEATDSPQHSMSVSGRTSVAAHWCPRGGDTDDRAQRPEVPPKRTRSAAVDPTSR